MRACCCGGGRHVGGLRYVKARNGKETRSNAKQGCRTKVSSRSQAGGFLREGTHIRSARGRKVRAVNRRRVAASIGGFLKDQGTSLPYRSGGYSGVGQYSAKSGYIKERKVSQSGEGWLRARWVRVFSCSVRRTGETKDEAREGGEGALICSGTG